MMDEKAHSLLGPQTCLIKVLQTLQSAVNFDRGPSLGGTKYSWVSARTKHHNLLIISQLSTSQRESLSTHPFLRPHQILSPPPRTPILPFMLFSFFFSKSNPFETNATINVIRCGRVYINRGM